MGDDDLARYRVGAAADKIGKFGYIIHIGLAFKLDKPSAK